MQYAMRGEIYLKAQAMKAAGRDVMYLNLGNPQSLGQKPFTFNRQVLALCVGGEALLGDEAVCAALPADVVARARELLKSTSGGVGSYTDSRGLRAVRDHVAEFITARDGTSERCCPESIYLSDGASGAVNMCLTAVIRGRQDGVLVPVPQYPLYSALIELHGGQFLGYELDESHAWGFNMEVLEESVRAARAKGITPRALVFINPGNPTGQCLSKGELQQLAAFARREKLVLMADEVYQSNVWTPERDFVSMRGALLSCEPDVRDHVELISFHTVSKGLQGECGLRGGYMQLTNIHSEAEGLLYKLASVTLCANVVGQLAVDVMVKPPLEGEPSYELFAEEQSALRGSLERKARRMSAAFDALDGMHCNSSEGALYVFPRLDLSPRAVAAAQEAERAADLFYCLELLEATGLVLVPGSGFGQKDGTWHMRTTILPPEERVEEVITKVSDFHNSFMAKYS
jgi:glutamate--glyoxylate aminotransferase